MSSHFLPSGVRNLLTRYHAGPAQPITYSLEALAHFITHEIWKTPINGLLTGTLSPSTRPTSLLLAPSTSRLSMFSSLLVTIFSVNLSSPSFHAMDIFLPCSSQSSGASKAATLPSVSRAFLALGRPIVPPCSSSSLPSWVSALCSLLSAISLSILQPTLSDQRPPT